MFNVDAEHRTMKRAKTDSDAEAALLINDAGMSVQPNSSTVSQNDSAASSTMTNMLTLLDENSLLQVLLRTCSEDHNALWKTCRFFRNIIDSELFRQERAQQEWAQVKTKVWTADDHIKDDTATTDDPQGFYSESVRSRYCALGLISDDEYGRPITNKFTIFVDGKIAGRGSYTVIERSSHVNFHAVCDELSQELMETACLFFDKKGRPRLPTLKKAIATSSTSSYRNQHLQNNYFLYLNTFTLNPEYRRNATWVGANALRSLLLDSPLKEKWEVVIYIADSRSNFTEQDKARDEMIQRERSLETEQEENEQVLRENNDWNDRVNCLAKDDLRQFLRCGFEQATDSVQKSSCLYVFAVPNFLDRPILSHKQAMVLNIVDKKQLSPDIAMSVEESKLLKFMVTSCIKRRAFCERIVENQANSPPTREELGRLADNEMGLISSRLLAGNTTEEHLDQLEALADLEEQRIEQTYQEDIIGPLMLEIEDVEGQRSVMEQRRVEHEALRRGDFEESELNDMQSMIEQLTARETASASRLVQLRELLSAKQEELEACRENIRDSRERLASSRSQRQAALEAVFQTISAAHSEALSTAHADLSRHDSEVKAEIGRLVGASEDGASIKNSNSLHACAAQMTPEYIDLLLEFVPQTERRSLLNMFDSTGLTPLMVVASVSRFSDKPELRYRMAEHLIELGADKNITDASGETALGRFRDMKRSMADLEDGFDMDENPQDHERMERLLWPIGGPTAADDACLDANDDEDDESEFESDEDDDDDDDELDDEEEE